MTIGTKRKYQKLTRRALDRAHAAETRALVLQQQRETLASQLQTERQRARERETEQGPNDTTEALAATKQANANLLQSLHAERDENIRLAQQLEEEQQAHAETGQKLGEALEQLHEAQDTQTQLADTRQALAGARADIGNLLERVEELRAGRDRGHTRSHALEMGEAYGKEAPPRHHMAGNPHYDRAHNILNMEPADAQGQALLAIAWELRTSNSPAAPTQEHSEEWEELHTISRQVRSGERSTVSLEELEQWEQEDEQ